MADRFNDECCTLTGLSVKGQRDQNPANTRTEAKQFPQFPILRCCCKE
jgi:hypothetical protein